MKKVVYLILALFTVCTAKSQCPVQLKYDTSFCASNFSITVDASVLDTSLCSDSVTIILNAANTVLANDTNVYFYSAPQFTPFILWGTNPYTTGSTTQNNGIGRMTSLGNNMWTITIHPQTYYNYPADTCLNGIWMVFHNYNGSVYLNSDNSSTNFFVYTNTAGQAVSTIDPDTVQAHKSVGRVTYKWSDNNTTNPRTFTTGGSYTVTATGPGGCSASGSVTIKGGGHAPVSLGSNMIRCVPNSPVTLNAGSGFASLLWLNDSVSTTRATYTATNPGCYWVLATDSSGCTSSSTVQIENTEVTDLSIPDSLNSCPGTQISVDASVNVNRLGDSIIIIYNAAKGTTQLTGVDTVYFHSGPQFTPSQGWQGSYTVGHYGLNDGVGEMTSLGNNLWRIAIDPSCYYKMNPDSLLTGIWMVFRNSDGTLTGKSYANGNIYIAINNGIPVSGSDVVTPSRTPRLPLTYNWSNSTSGPVLTVTSANNYTVTLSDNNGCSAIKSVNITFNNLPAIYLGADTTVCIDASVSLAAPGGFKHYSWSNNDTTESILASAAGDYSVTATDSLGCHTSGSIQVSTDTNSANFPVITITPSDSVVCGNAYTTLQADTGFASYTWNTGASTNYLYVKDSGTYTLTVTNSFGCSKSSSFSIDTCGTRTDTVPVNPVVGCGSPKANFVVLSVGPDNSVTFKDKSQIAKKFSYLWSFGDGTTDIDTGSTVHTYATPGYYTVILEIRDSCGGTSGDTLRVDVNVTGIPAISGLNSFTVFPNPNYGTFNVQVNLEEQTEVSFLLYNSLGQLVWQKNNELNSGPSRMTVDAGNLIPGIYMLELVNNSERAIKNITIIK